MNATPMPILTIVTGAAPAAPLPAAAPALSFQALLANLPLPTATAAASAPAAVPAPLAPATQAAPVVAALETAAEAPATAPAQSMLSSLLAPLCAEGVEAADAPPASETVGASREGADVEPTVANPWFAWLATPLPAVPAASTAISTNSPPAGHAAPAGAAPAGAPARGPDPQAAVPATISGGPVADGVPAPTFAVSAAAAAVTAMDFAPVAAEPLPFTFVAAPLPGFAETLRAPPSPLPVAYAVPVPFGHAQWAERVAQGVLLLAGAETSQAQLILDPAELGPVDVRIDFGGDKVSVHFAAAHPSTRDALEGTVRELRELMGQLGLTLDQTSVSSDSFRDRREAPAAPSPQRHGATGDAQPSRAPAPVIVRRNGLVDDYA